MKESLLRGNSAPIAGRRYLAEMQQQNPVRTVLIFQSGFYAVTTPASGSLTKTASAVNAESPIKGSPNKINASSGATSTYERATFGTRSGPGLYAARLIL
jgi:hypothetical protein